jgi:hypothetical protein
MYSAALRSLFIFPVFFLMVFSAVAEEEGEHGEKKAKQPEKPKPDSVISAVMALSEVQAWGKWIQSKNNGHSISAWGESMRTVEEHNQCWEVAVGEIDAAGDNIRVWKRFCVTQGGSVWVESRSKEFPDETTYVPYDSWKKECSPSSNSPGKC